MVFTKEEFKRQWDSEGCCILFKDVADCAKAWGLYSRPMCADIKEVRYRVCEAAGVENMPENPFKKEDVHTVTEDFAWQVYNVINRWKAGEFGEYPLQDILDKEL